MSMMKKLIIKWEKPNTNECKISHMEIGNNYEYLTAPNEYTIDTENQDSEHVKNHIDQHVREIFDSLNSSVVVYKSVATHYNPNLPHEFSKYFDQIITEKINSLNLKRQKRNGSHKRKKNEFKNALKILGYTNHTNREKYKWELWDLAIKGNFEKKIKKLWKKKYGIKRLSKREDIEKWLVFRNEITLCTMDNETK